MEVRPVCPTFVKSVANVLVVAATVSLITLSASRAEENGPSMAPVSSGVATGTPSPTGDTNIKNSSEDWTWTGMQTVTGKQFPSGSVNAGGVDTTGVVVFMGTGFKLYGIADSQITVDGTSHALGKVGILVDGKQKAVVDMRTPPSIAASPVYQENDLAPGNHVLEVKVIDGWGAIDHISVQNTPAAVRGKDYHLYPKNAPDKWLDVRDDSMADGDPLQINSAPRLNHSQIWHIEPVGKGLFKISPKERPDECITVLMPTATSPVDTDPCAVYKYIGHPDQQWQIIPDKPGFFKIYNLHQAKCLNVFQMGTADGTAVNAYIWSNNNQDNDEWELVPAQ